jgi:hypothetical protein
MLAMGNLAKRLLDADQLADSATMVENAVEMCRSLVDAYPDRHLPPPSDLNEPYRRSRARGLLALIVDGLHDFHPKRLRGLYDLLAKSSAREDYTVEYVDVQARAAVFLVSAFRKRGLQTEADAILHSLENSGPVSTKAKEFMK